MLNFEITPVTNNFELLRKSCDFQFIPGTNEFKIDVNNNNFEILKKEVKFDMVMPNITIIQNMLGALQYIGKWNASIGSYPENAEKGFYWIISVPGTIDGIEYSVPDWIVYNGTDWDKIDNSEFFIESDPIFEERLENNPTTGTNTGDQDVQLFELQNCIKTGYDKYQEFERELGKIIQINYWSDNEKTEKLFTKNIQYLNDYPTIITTKDEKTNKILTTTITYSGSDIVNISKVLS